MRQIRYYEHKRKGGQPFMERVLAKDLAVFHRYGSNYEDGEVYGNYTTAIIELQDGKILNVPVEDVEFVNPTKIEEVTD